jgi:hypothetical protein
MTALDVILNGLRASFPPDEVMTENEERGKERERFRWMKCEFCGTPYREIWGSPCPYCKNERR